MHIWTCPDCGQDVPPLRYKTGDTIRLFRRRDCDCEVAQARLAEAQQARAEEERREQLNRLFYSSGLSAQIYRRFSFERWDCNRNRPHSTEALVAIKKFAKEVEDGGRNWTWLHGAYGLGKTHLSIAAVRAIMIKNLWEPHVIVWPELCQLTQESWSTGGNETESWSRARRAKVLLIDDIDKTSTGQWAMEKLYTLINWRYERELPTIITANKSITELRNIWYGSKYPHVADTGMAILSRVVGRLWGTIEFKGADQRMVR